MKKTNRVLLIAVPFFFFATQAVAQGSHCSKNEKTVFSCEINEKVVSVCASKNLTPTTGYMQYRYGKVGATELQIPALNAHPLKHVEVNATEGASGNSGTINFKNGLHTYSIYWSSYRSDEESKNGSSIWVEDAGLIVSKAANVISRAKCEENGSMVQPDTYYLHNQVGFSESADKEKWVKQKATTGHLDFSVQFALFETECCGPNTPVAIKVIESKSNAVKQVIKLKGALPDRVEENKRVRIFDVNFDGYDDLSFLISSHREDITTFYLYNPHTKLFEFNADLVFSDVVVDEENKTITSSARLSPQGYTSEVYRFIKGKLTLIKSIKDDFEYMEIKSRLKDGTMKTITQFSFNGESPAPLTANTLCRENEHVYFSCKVKGAGEIASLCAPSTIENDWLQFRLGEADNLEVVFPKNKTNSTEQFKGEYHFHNNPMYPEKSISNASVAFYFGGLNYLLDWTAKGDSRSYSVSTQSGKGDLSEVGASNWTDLGCVDGQGYLAPLAKTLVQAGSER